MNRNYKDILRACCLEMLDKGIEASMKAMQEAQESANQEEKSSMGDKYETGRAMSHLERDMHARQLVQLQAERNKLLRLSDSTTFMKAASGALIETRDKTYWIAVALGQVKCEGRSVMVVSPDSPVAKAMLGKKAGDTFQLRDKAEVIVSVN